jgi:hypothetical protein
MLSLYSLYQPLGANFAFGPKEIQRYYKKLGKNVSDADAVLMTDLFLYGPDPKTGLPLAPPTPRPDGDGEALPSIDFAKFCQHLAQRAGACAAPAIQEAEELMRTLSPNGVDQVLVAAGVAQGSEVMKRMKGVIGDPRTKTYAESDLAGRMAEALPGRKVAQKKAGMLGGALQMNFRSGASPASPHQAAPGAGNTVRF